MGEAEVVFVGGRTMGLVCNSNDREDWIILHSMREKRQLAFEGDLYNHRPV